MKITLHKPQRETANAVLAYEDEDGDTWVEKYTVYYTKHHVCNDARDSCERKVNAASCDLDVTFGEVNGVPFETSSC